MMLLFSGTDAKLKKRVKIGIFCGNARPILMLPLNTVQSNDNEEDHVVSWLRSHEFKLTWCSFGKALWVLLIFYWVNAKTYIRYRTHCGACRGRYYSVESDQTRSILWTLFPWTWTSTWLYTTLRPTKKSNIVSL